MPKRSRPSAFARRLESADRPLYLLDEEQWLIAANAAVCLWTGWELDRLLTLRCSYHSRPTPEGATDWSAALCPPPEAFDGQIAAGNLTWIDERGNVRQRLAQFVTLSLGAIGRGLLVAVGDEKPAAALDDSPVVDSDQLHAAIWSWRARLRSRFDLARLAGSSASAQRVCQQVQAARQATSANVLVWGPPGSGRESVARCIAAGDTSPDSSTLITVDSVAATAEDVRAAAARAAPTGGGLLVCDVDRLSPVTQRDLRTWQSPAGVRLLATSGQPLTAMAARGEFDPELAQRLSVIPIELTPLSQRLIDLPQVVQALIEDINAAGDKQLAGITPEALERLALHPWQGDVAELQGVLHGACQRAEGHYVTGRDLPAELELARQAATHRPPQPMRISLVETLAQTERALIEEALTKARGNRAKAARALGLSRPRLYRRMVHLGLAVEAEGDDATSDFEEQAEQSP